MSVVEKGISSPQKNHPQLQIAIYLLAPLRRTQKDVAHNYIIRNEEHQGDDQEFKDVARPFIYIVGNPQGFDQNPHGALPPSHHKKEMNLGGSMAMPPFLTATFASGILCIILRPRHSPGSSPPPRPKWAQPCVEFYPNSVAKELCT